VPFLAGNKLAWKDHYIGGARLGKAHVSACAESGRVRKSRTFRLIQADPAGREQASSEG
jgi:hypothetical protein